VTLPRPDLADSAAVAPWARVVRARRVGPHGQPWRRGLVTALTGLMSDLPDAVWVYPAATDQERRAPTVRLRLVEVDRQAPRRLVHGDREPPAVDLRIQLDFVVGHIWSAMSRTEPCFGDSCTTRRWDRAAAVVDRLDVRRVLSVPVQLDGRPVGMLDVHVTSRGLVGKG
jgi:hypothetical protein